MPINRVTKIDLPAGMSFTQTTDAKLWTYDAQCGSQKHTQAFFIFFKRNCMFEFCSMFPNKYIYFRLNQCVKFIHPHLPYWWSYELISILFAFIIWYNTFCGLSWYVQLMFYDVICTKLNQLHAVITVHVHLQQLFGGLSMKGHSANNLVISAHGKD